jgi:pimeloyl-ACP methyl ester carboxylesterase
MALELTASPREQTRARYPDHSGYAERDGGRLFYDVYGAGGPTILLLPTWSLFYSRVWKMQIPHLARHCRVVTFDGLGNGRSDRPRGASAYDEREFAADALAVLDTTETERAVIIGFSLGGQRGVILAAEHPERVAGAVFIGPNFPGGGTPLPERMAYDFDEEYDAPEGWAKHNRYHWLRDYRD